MFKGRSRDAMEPLCFAILKSLTPPDIETALVDERVEDVPLDLEVELVAMTVETYTSRRAYQIADSYRSNGVPVVMGGYHPTLLPGECLEHADAVVIGDAEGTWEQLVDDVRRQNLQTIYRQTEFPSLEGLQPDRSIFSGKRYAPLGLVQVGRGCRFNCEFCSIHAFYGNSLRQRPLEDVAEEIRSCGRRHIFLVDDNLFVDTASAQRLFEMLARLDISWSCQVSIDIARDPKLVKMMARSGCILALVGFESLDTASLREINKGWNLKWQSFEDAIRVFNEAGIMLYGTFVFGCENHTRESFDRTVEFAMRHRFFLANFNPLTPTPVAPLHDRLKREGRLLHERWWLDPGFHYGDATFVPGNMSPGELIEGCYLARTRFNTWRSIMLRLLDHRTNMRTPYRAGLYLAANAISRHEIHRKQGRLLGEIA